MYLFQDKCIYVGVCGLGEGEAMTLYDITGSI